MTLPNIGLIGKLRAGKDVVAAYLASKYGYTQFAFGDGLKDVCRALYPEQFADGKKPRALLQGFGQDARKYDESVWVRKCLDKIAQAYEWRGGEVNARFPFRAVITDVRQISEAEALAARSYVLIRVTAPDGLRIERAINSGDTFNYADLAHGTETALDGYAADFTVVNDEGLAELYAQIDEIIAYLTIREAA